MVDNVVVLFPTTPTEPIGWISDLASLDRMYQAGITSLTVRDDGAIVGAHHRNTDLGTVMAACPQADAEYTYDVIDLYEHLERRHAINAIKARGGDLRELD